VLALHLSCSMTAYQKATQREQKAERLKERREMLYHLLQVERDQLEVSFACHKLLLNSHHRRS